MRMPFGKYKGEELSAIPDSYLWWLLDNVEDLSPRLRTAIEEYLELDTPSNGVPSENTIRAWYSALCRRYHPDRGGSHEAMQVVNEAKEVLERIMKGEEP